MPAVQANFFRKKSGNAVVQTVYKKNCRLFPSDMSLGKIPLKDKTLEVKSVEKSNSKGYFPSDMSLGKISFPSDMSLGNILPPWHQFLDQKIRGAHFSLGIVAGERFAIELTPSTFPQRHFAGENPAKGQNSRGEKRCKVKLKGKSFLSDISLGIDFPSEMSLAKGSECCWGRHRML
ncbi:hypothetical protein Tco_0722218 [Tanacetum coccineum]